MKMYLRNSGVFFLLAIIFSCHALLAQEKNSEKSLLWKVSGNGLTEPSYLFGTYHLLGDKFLTEVPEIQKSFAEAKGVVVETLIDSSKLQGIMMKSMMTEKKISTLISPEDFKLVSDELKRLSGYDLAMLDRFKPAQVNALIMVMSAQQLHADVLTKYSGIPLDVYFATEGKKQNKVVTPFETMEEQFTMLLDHFPVEEQAKQLVEAVRQKDFNANVGTDMVKLYLAKDLDGLHTLMESYPQELTGNMDYMLKDRNANWMNVLPALMKSGSQFIAVGAAHLTGPDGLLTLLKKQGYTLTPVTK
jgi:uncharacterized protein